jgi:hypothetical protein
MGALVAGLYASGKSPAELRALAVSDAFTNVFTLQTPYADASFRRRQDRHDVPQAITIGLKDGPHVRNALFSDLGVNEFLTANMPAYNREDLDYNQLPIPFRCVATDLNTLRSITISSGPLPRAVRASISIPDRCREARPARRHCDRCPSSGLCDFRRGYQFYCGGTESRIFCRHRAQRGRGGASGRCGGGCAHWKILRRRLRQGSATDPGRLPGGRAEPHGSFALLP